MKKLQWILIVISILIFNRVTAQKYNITLDTNIIIDVDGAIDDIRAVVMLLSVKELNIEAFISCGGTLNSKETRDKIVSLIKKMNIKDTCYIIQGKDNKVYPPWRKFNQSVQWEDGKNKVNIKNIDISGLQKNISDSNIVYICLGPLSNVSDIITNYPDLHEKIKKVIWFNGEGNLKDAFNYKADSLSANIVLSSGIEVDIVRNTGKDDYNLSMLENMDSTNIFASFISSLLEQKGVKDKLLQGHAGLWDDLVPVYLLYPEFFKMKYDFHSPHIKRCVGYDIDLIEELIPLIYSQKYSLDKQIVFSKIPVDSSLFRYDIQMYMSEIIAKYGQGEWKACILTHEFHGHLGIYSLVGAKMGIKALEILHAPIDQVHVISFAGSKPPISCFTDGIQVSTGATLGRGLISISDELEKRPEAIFTYKDKSVGIKLKQEVWNQIEQDISKGIVEYGLLSQGYWMMIRRQSIKYWLEFDRDEIFDITIESNSK